MGEGEIHVLRHAVLPAVLMAASSDSSSSGGMVDKVTNMMRDAVSKDKDEKYRTELIEEHTDVSKEEYQKEMKRTAEEAKRFDRVFIEESTYGDEVANYLRENVPDVTIERYGEPSPEDERIRKIYDVHGSYSDISWKERQDLMEGWTNAILRNHRKEYKERREGGGIANYVNKIGQIFAQATESSEDFIVHDDNRSWKDLPAPPGSGDASLFTAGAAEDEGYESGLGSTDKSTSYDGEVVDEFMSTGFNEYAKVRTGDDDVTYLKNGEETSQQAYAAASASRAPDKDLPEKSEDISEGMDEYRRDEAEDDEDEREEGYTGRMRDALENTYQAVKLGEDKESGQTGYEDLVERVEYANEQGEDSLIIASSYNESGVEGALEESGHEYTFKDALED